MSQTQDPLPKVYGNLYSFEDGRLYDIFQLNEDEPSMTMVHLSKIVSDENGLANTRENIYNIDVMSQAMATAILPVYL